MSDETQQFPRIIMTTINFHVNYLIGVNGVAKLPGKDLSKRDSDRERDNSYNKCILKERQHVTR